MLQISINGQVFVANGVVSLDIEPTADDWRFVTEAVDDSEDWGMVTGVVGSNDDWGIAI